MIGTKLKETFRDTAGSIQEAIKNTTGLVTAALAIGAAALLLSAATLVLVLKMRKNAYATS